MKELKYFLQKVLAIVLLLLSIMFFITFFGTDDTNLKKLFIVLALLLCFCSIQLFKIKRNGERNINTDNIISYTDNSLVDKENINQYNILENITKRIDFKTRPATSFLVDDNSKKFAYVGKRNTYIFNYKDLIDFEYKENGQVLISGKTLPAAIGGATFGVVGSIIGSSGKRKQTNVVKESNVILYLNKLETPSLKIIIMDQSKLSVNYKEQVTDLIGTLNYITNNKEEL